MMQYPFAHTASQYIEEAIMALRGHHDELCLELIRFLQYRLNRVTFHGESLKPAMFVAPQVNIRKFGLAAGMDHRDVAAFDFHIASKIGDRRN